MDQNIISILIYVAPVLVSFCVSAGVGAYLVARRRVAGARSFAVLIFCETTWGLGMLFELLSPSLEGKIFWDNIQWIPTLAISLAFLSFAIQYSGRPRLKLWMWAALVVVPLLSLVMIFTNPLHGLAMSDIKLVPGDPFSEYTYAYGPVIWAALAYFYVIIVWSIGLLVRLAVRQRGLYRVQTWVTIIGLLIPIIATIPSVFDIKIGPQRDDSAYVFILSNLFLVFGFSRYRMFQLVPIARDMLIDRMEDGEIVLDPLGRLLDFNPAARGLVGKADFGHVGAPFDHTAGDWFQAVKLDPSQKSVHQEISIDSNPEAKTIDLRTTHLTNQDGSLAGYLLILRDVSEQKQARAQLEKSYAQVQQQVAERTAQLSNSLHLVEEEISERRQAEQALQKQFQQYGTLVELSSALLESVPDYARVLQLSVQRCTEQIGDGASIFLYHPSQDFLELVAADNPDAGLLDYFWNYMQANPVRADEGSYSRVIQSGQPLLVPVIDMEQIIAHSVAERREYFQKLPLYSAMYAPLMVEGSCIGVLGIGRHQPDHPPYTLEDLDFFREVANLSAIAIWQSRLMDSLQKELAERKRVERTLRESEEKYRVLFSHSGDAILLIENEVIVDCNESAPQLFGLPREAVIGQRPDELSPALQQDGERSDQKAAWLIAKALREGYARFEWTHQRSNGQSIETEVILDAIGVGGSQILQATVRDMTVWKRAEEEVKQAYEATLEGWARALELRELETAHHSDRVVDLTLTIARQMGLCDDLCASVRQGALLHDIGKMGIPDSILLKKGPLDEGEWAIMRQHPVYAYTLLSRIPYLQAALEIPYCHHERWDGSGYPRGLKGEEIPRAARIFAVVDVWDALTMDRPYRKAWTKEAAQEYLVQNAGVLFDEKVVKAFLEIVCK